MNLSNFGKETKRGVTFSAQDKEISWNDLCGLSNVTATHENRKALERYAELTEMIDRLEAERKQLAPICEGVITDCGRQFGTDGNKWVAFIRQLGKAVPFVLTIVEQYQRADFSGWCKAHNITAEQVIADGFTTQVQRSVKIAPAGKTHIDTLIRENCFRLYNSKRK